MKTIKSKTVERHGDRFIHTTELVTVDWLVFVVLHGTVVNAYKVAAVNSDDTSPVGFRVEPLLETIEGVKITVISDHPCLMHIAIDAPITTVIQLAEEEV